MIHEAINLRNLSVVFKISSVTSVPAMEDELEDGHLRRTAFDDENSAEVLTGANVGRKTFLNHLQNSFLWWTPNFGEGIISDVTRRRAVYRSDWSDGIHQNLASATFFLYFACLLPSIAFGALNESTTERFFSVEKTIISQAIGGILFSLFSTQPLVILLSTAPLAIFIKLAYNISISENIPFASFYAWIGIFNSIFLVIFGITNMPDKFLKNSSPFLCETFGLFISVALSFDAIKALILEFILNYNKNTRDSPLLWLILMYATVTLGLYVKNIRNTKLFHPSTCEMIGDFALPISILITSFLGSFVFKDIHLLGFNSVIDVNLNVPTLLIEMKGILIAIPLGFALSLLMFIDQSISVALISTSKNNLQKGIYYHFDIILIAILTAILSILGLPWVHGALPHTPMHATALAETENTSERKIIKAIESRLAVFLSHVFIGISYFLLPVPLKFIPYPVLYGLFLYLAVTALPGNSFYHRLLIVMRDSRPLFQQMKKSDVENIDKFYSELKSTAKINATISVELIEEIKRQDDVKEIKDNMKEEVEIEIENERLDGIHIEKNNNDEEGGLDLNLPFPTLKNVYQLTLIQFFCLLLLCVCGLYPSPYLNVCFPILLFLFMPFRSIILKYLFGNNIDLLDPLDLDEIKST